MRKAITYVRTNNKAKSCESLMEKCVDYANDHELLVDQTFIDEGFSGLTTNRPSLEEMIKYLKDNNGITVVSPSASHISRDTLEFQKFISFLNETGNSLSILDAKEKLNYAFEAPVQDDLPAWRKELKKVNRCPQRQDATLDQLEDLYIIAVKFGFYDAADAIKKNLIDR